MRGFFDGLRRQQWRVWAKEVLLFQFATPDWWELWYLDDWEARNSWKTGDPGKPLQLWFFDPEWFVNPDGSVLMSQLTISAGSFQAVVIRVECGCGSDFFPYRRWFAVGMGLVSVGEPIPPLYESAWVLREAVVNGVRYPKGDETQSERTTWGRVKQQVNR
jgi:hypothetical protein